MTIKSQYIRLLAEDTLFETVLTQRFNIANLNPEADQAPEEMTGHAALKTDFKAGRWARSKGQYVCNSKGTKFEAVQGEAVIDCPACVQRLAKLGYQVSEI